MKLHKRPHLKKMQFCCWRCGVQPPGVQQIETMSKETVIFTIKIQSEAKEIALKLLNTDI